MYFACSKCVSVVSPIVFCMFQMCFGCSNCVLYVPNCVFLAPNVFRLFHQLCFVYSKCVLLVPNVFRLFQLCFVCFKCIFKVFIVSTFVSNVLNIICFVFCTYGPPYQMFAMAFNCFLVLTNVVVNNSQISVSSSNSTFVPQFFCNL